MCLEIAKQNLEIPSAPSFSFHTVNPGSLMHPQLALGSGKHRLASPYDTCRKVLLGSIWSE